MTDQNQFFEIDGQKVLNNLPDLANFAKEAYEGVSVQFSDAPVDVKRKEAKEALMSGYHDVIENLIKDFPEFVDAGVEAVVDNVLKVIIPGDAQ